MKKRTRTPAALARALSTHLNARGEVRMVDVGAKSETERVATARATVSMRPETAARLRAGDTPKGDVLATVRIAAIMATKRTPELIPLCHTIALTRVDVVITLEEARAIITVRTEARDRTGVEMEAMVGAAAAALTMYDMLKGIDRGMRFEVALDEKSGGKKRHLDSFEVARMLIDLRDAAVTLDEAVSHVARTSAGGIATFVGVVREESEGRAVSKLEYSAYDSMARAEMTRIAEEIERELPGTRVAALHRLGALAVSDIAVVCAASAPHRDDAFRACRLLIDRIKARVPIWKREHGPDGAAWVGWVDARCHAEHHERHEH